MAEGMAVLRRGRVPHIARRWGIRRSCSYTDPWELCAWREFGKTGVAFMANPVIPDLETGANGRLHSPARGLGGPPPSGL